MVTCNVMLTQMPSCRNTRPSFLAYRSMGMNKWSGAPMNEKGRGRDWTIDHKVWTAFSIFYCLLSPYAAQPAQAASFFFTVGSASGNPGTDVIVDITFTPDRKSTRP